MFLKDRSFAWLGLGAVNCIGLARHMRFDLFVCASHGLDSEWAASRTGATLISDERQSSVRARGEGRGLEALLEGPLGSQIVSALLERPCCVLSWHSIEPLEALAAASNGRLLVLAPPAALKRRLDDKIAFRQALGELGIEPVPHVVCDLHAVEFEENERRFGLPFVVQFASSDGGSGTFFISSQHDLRMLQDEKDEQQAMVSSFISNVSPNINAVVCDDLLLLSHPSLQLVGVPECTSNPSGYCGNDFAAAQRLSDATIQSMYDQTRKIGSWIARQGFRGLWGLDFAVDGSDVYPLEVNPRLQGSTPLLTELQHMTNRVPLMLAHVAGFLDGGQALLERLAAHWGEPQPHDGAQMVLFSKESDWSVVRGSLRPGVYVCDGAQATYRRQGLTIADCWTADEFVVTGNVPLPGTRVQAGVPLCKIQTRREVLDGASNKLRAWAAQVCDWVYDALALS